MTSTFQWLAAFVLLFFSACAVPQHPGGAKNSDTPLLGTRWQLTELDGTRTPPDARQFLVLHADGERRAEGFAGCNRFSGGYTLDGETLRFGPLALTRRICPRMSAETAFTRALAQTDRYEVHNGTLTLFEHETPLARFKPAASE